MSSPTFMAFFNAHPVRVTLDCGANASTIHISLVQRLQLSYSPTVHKPSQADGKTKLKPLGEVHFSLTRGPLTFNVEAVVVENLDCELLAGMPFMYQNKFKMDIPAKRAIVHQHHIIPFIQDSSSFNRSTPYLLRSTKKCTIHNDEYVEFNLPPDIPDGAELCIQPTVDTTWLQPVVTTAVDGILRLCNYSDEPISVRKNQHIAELRSSQEPCPVTPPDTPFPQINSMKTPTSYSATVTIDPDGMLTSSDIAKFTELNAKYDQVYNPEVGKYNDASGRVRAKINIGPVEPPPQKGRIPLYNHSQLNELQEKMDVLEGLGVLARPEDLNITVEHVSPSFLVNKPNGGKRFVTAFKSIAMYAKKPPSRATSTDDIHSFLAQWKFTIKSDMTEQFHHLPLDHNSIKYAGVISPHKGTRVYTRAAMGMPGSTEYLDELTYRVLGDLIHEGHTAKIADDLYAGANTIEELLVVWEKILAKFQENNLRLSARKTVICPKTTTVLGWIWSQGTLSVSPHKINPLATAPPPTTVKALRGWLGAYKHIRRCIRQYSSLLASLETACAGKESREKIQWTDELQADFQKAQEALKDLKTITVPRRSDKLIITTDGAVRNAGIGAVLYINRNGTIKLGGYFSAKLTQHQIRWLPCEIEALGIHLACEHWKMDILNSDHITQILTDSKPCVQASHKLENGEFSSSNRVSTFLSTLSRFRLKVTHISATENLPADYLSRNPMECEHGNCQMCKFITESENASVMSISVCDVAEGRVPMPFANPLVWKSAQQDCKDCRQAFTFLQRANRPTRKMTKITDVKRYLNVCSINRDKVLIVKKEEPFVRTRNLVVIPRHVLAGLLTALHIRLRHPTKHQLTKQFNRHFYALDSDKMIAHITSTCDHCASLKTLPREMAEYSTSVPPSVPGVKFACDVMRRAKQYVFVTRDCFSSFTLAQIIPSEDKNALRDAIIQTTSLLKTPENTVVRADGAPALQSLVGDKILTNHGITLEIGRSKNRNKNPIADKAIRELEDELKRQCPSGKAITATELALVIATLNSRIRNRALSAREILFQRDANTGEQLKFKDCELSDEQYKSRLSNHGPSAKSKSRGGKMPASLNLAPGDLVYLKEDGDKHTARSMYLVKSREKEFVIVQKFLEGTIGRQKYRLRCNDVYRVPSSANLANSTSSDNQVEGESEVNSDSDETPLRRHDDGVQVNSADKQDSDDSESSASESETSANSDLNVPDIETPPPPPKRSGRGRNLIPNPKYYSREWFNNRVLVE